MPVKRVDHPIPVIDGLEVHMIAHALDAALVGRADEVGIGALVVGHAFRDERGPLERERLGRPADHRAVAVEAVDQHHRGLPRLRERQRQTPPQLDEQRARHQLALELAAVRLQVLSPAALKAWRGDIGWQVWNAAVPGYNTSQELAHLIEVLASQAERAETIEQCRVRAVELAQQQHAASRSAFGVVFEYWNRPVSVTTAM